MLHHLLFVLFFLTVSCRDTGSLFSPPEQLVFPVHLIDDKDARIPATLAQLSDPQVVGLKEKFRYVVMIF